MFGNKNILVSAVLLAVMTLIGCGANAPAESQVNGNQASESRGNESRGNGNSVSWSLAKESSANESAQQQKATNGAAASETTAEEGTTESRTGESILQDDSAGAGQIYGNGSYFVKVGDKVFFHDYENAVAAEPSQGGGFLWLQGGLDCYDEVSGTLTRISDEKSSGELYLCGDEFYLAQEDAEGGSQIIRISMDGEVYRVGPGSVKGVSSDGSMAALWCNDASKRHLDVLDARNNQYCRVDEPDNGSIDFCGFSSSGIIYQKKVDDEIKLYSMGYGSNEVCLGTLSDLGIYGSLECDDFICDDRTDDIYCVFASYGGPVDMVEDYLIVKANVGKEDSLSLLQHGYDQEKMPSIGDTDEPSLRLNNGNLSYGFYDEDKLYLSHSYMGSRMLGRFVYGNLLWCDDRGEVQTIIKNFIPYMDRDIFVMQTGQVLGDEAYLLVALVKRNENSDYKLSQAFDFKRMYVLRVPLKESSKAEAIAGDDFEKNMTFDEKGFEPYVGNWRMDDFIVEDGIMPSHSRNMWIGITDEQELSFMDDEEYSGFPFVLSTSVTGDECLIVGYNEVFGISCTGKLVKDGGEERLILEVQESKENIDDPGPDSWKGSFHRATDEEWAAEWGSG